MTRRLLVALLALALVAGCGSDDEEESASPQTQGEQTQTQESAAVSDQQQIRVLGDKYLKAFAKEDWDTVCSTLSPRARARFRRKAGSCQKLYEASTAKAVKLAKKQEVLQIKMQGDDRATMTIGTPTYGVEGRMYAAKIDGEWFLYVKRAAKGAP